MFFILTFIRIFYFELYFSVLCMCDQGGLTIIMTEAALWQSHARAYSFRIFCSVLALGPNKQIAQLQVHTFRLQLLL